MNALIRIVDLEVYYHVGVPDQEREKPQRLLLTLELEHDASRAAASDDLQLTIDYFQLSQELLRFGDGKSWKLLEKLTEDICDFVLARFAPEAVSVEAKKFVIPQARYVSLRNTKRRSAGCPSPGEKTNSGLQPG